MERSIPKIDVHTLYAGRIINSPAHAPPVAQAPWSVTHDQLRSYVGSRLQAIATRDLFANLERGGRELCREPCPLDPSVTLIVHRKVFHPGSTTLPHASIDVRLERGTDEICSFSFDRHPGELWRNEHRMVRPAYRRKGVFSAVLGAVEDQLVKGYASAIEKTQKIDFKIGQPELITRLPPGYGPASAKDTERLEDILTAKSHLVLAYEYEYLHPEGPYFHPDRLLSCFSLEDIMEDGKVNALNLYRSNSYRVLLEKQLHPDTAPAVEQIMFECRAPLSGMHMRNAASLARGLMDLLPNQDVRVTVSSERGDVDGRSIIGVMTLGIAEKALFRVSLESPSTIPHTLVEKVRNHLAYYMRLVGEPDA